MLSNNVRHAHSKNRNEQKSYKAKLDQLTQSESQRRHQNCVEIEKWRHFLRENMKTSGWSSMAMSSEVLDYGQWFDGPDEIDDQHNKSPRSHKSRVDRENASAFKKPWVFSLNVNSYNKVFRELEMAGEISRKFTMSPRLEILNSDQVPYAMHPSSAKHIPATSGLQRAKSARFYSDGMPQSSQSRLPERPKTSTSYNRHLEYSQKKLTKPKSPDCLTKPIAPGSYLAQEQQTAQQIHSVARIKSALVSSADDGNESTRETPIATSTASPRQTSQRTNDLHTGNECCTCSFCRVNPRDGEREQLINTTFVFIESDTVINGSEGNKTRPELLLNGRESNEPCGSIHPSLRQDDTCCVSGSFRQGGAAAESLQKRAVEGEAFFGRHKRTIKLVKSNQTNDLRSTNGVDERISPSCVSVDLSNICYDNTLSSRDGKMCGSFTTKDQFGQPETNVSIAYLTSLQTTSNGMVNVFDDSSETSMNPKDKSEVKNNQWAEVRKTISERRHFNSLTVDSSHRLAEGKDSISQTIALSDQEMTKAEPQACAVASEVEAIPGDSTSLLKMEKRKAISNAEVNDGTLDRIVDGKVKVSDREMKDARTSETVREIRREKENATLSGRRDHSAYSTGSLVVNIRRMGRKFRGQKCRPKESVFYKMAQTMLARRAKLFEDVPASACSEKSNDSNSESASPNRRSLNADKSSCADSMRWTLQGQDDSVDGKTHAAQEKESNRGNKNYRTVNGGSCGNEVHLSGNAMNRRSIRVDKMNNDSNCPNNIAKNLITATSYILNNKRSAVTDVCPQQPAGSPSGKSFMMASEHRSPSCASINLDLKPVTEDSTGSMSFKANELKCRQMKHKGIIIKNYTPRHLRYKTASLDSRNTDIRGRWHNSRKTIMSASQDHSSPRVVNVLFPQHARQLTLAKMVEDNHAQPIGDAAKLANAALRKRIDTFLLSIEPFCLLNRE